METKTIRIYASYGELGHEKQPAYSATAHGEIYDVYTVEIPNVTGTLADGELVVSLDGTEYALHEVLGNDDQAPALIWYPSPFARFPRKLRLNVLSIEEH